MPNVSVVSTSSSTSTTVNYLTYKELDRILKEFRTWKMDDGKFCLETRQKFLKFAQRFLPKREIEIQLMWVSFINGMLIE